MFHFIKPLEKEICAAAALALAIAAFTAEGVGGAGRSAMTAMAGTPAVSSEEIFEETGAADFPESGGGSSGGGDGRTSRGEAAGVWQKAGAAESFGGTALGETAEGGCAGTDGGSLQAFQAGRDGDTKYGRQVVGYFLEKDRKRQMQADAAARGEASSRENAGEDFLNREDYQVLLKIVEAEAGVCDDKGKILVANVILNRVKSDEFPDSVTDVVYQPSQFSPVSNGSIDTCEVSGETVDSVNRALKGEDYSQGALFFMNRAASRSGAVQWFDGRLTYLFGHQGHEFFK